MDSLLLFVGFIVFVALVFDYINGFHDAANSIATVVATRVLTPFQAVLWAAFFNFVAAVPLLLGGGAGVASTVGKELVNTSYVTPNVILGWGQIWTAIKIEGWIRTTQFIVLAPLLGLALGYLLMAIVYWMFRNSTPKMMDRWFRRLQLLSSALFSFSHGSNDAQKTAGIITGVLVSAGYLKEFHVPPWVIFAAFVAIAAGTMSGGWRIVHTMGGRLTRLKPRGGFCAETAGAIAILFPTYLKIPVSTTHVITGAIAGVGLMNRPKSVRWGLATNILWAWVLTLPASAFVAGACYWVIHLTGLGQNLK